MNENVVLVTGGTGFIGSHASVALLAAGYRVVILDNLANSEAGVLDGIEDVAGVRPAFVQGDIRDRPTLDRLLARYRPQAVMHFAGLKAVGESVREPLKYWEWNVGGTITLLQAMADYGLRTLVFSSSATVYGDPQAVPIREDAPIAPTNPYGRTKAAVEELLANLAQSDSRWRIARLRYFNPVGAHPSGRLGEAPQGVPNNLMPYVAQVAQGLRAQLAVFGNDYPTADGTGVRDYIHIMDLVDGHLAALRRLQEVPGMLTVNLGTGRGYSVLEMIAAFEQASGRRVPFEIAPRRAGDVAVCYADPGAAKEMLGWQARRGIAEMCSDAWRWELCRVSGG